jgi:hypothetical protein
MQETKKRSNLPILIDIANLFSIFGLILGFFITYYLLVQRPALNKTAYAMNDEIASPVQKVSQQVADTAIP